MIDYKEQLLKIKFPIYYCEIEVKTSEDEYLLHETILFSKDEILNHWFVERMVEINSFGELRSWFKEELCTYSTINGLKWFEIKKYDFIAVFISKLKTL